MLDNGKVFAKLVHIAVKNGIIVRFAPLQYNNGRLKGNRLAIRQDMQTIEEYNYTLAHELAHSFLHYDKGDTITSEKHDEYEEQADRAAQMLLIALAAE